MPRLLLLLAVVLALASGACGGSDGPPPDSTFQPSGDHSWSMLGYDLASSFHNPVEAQISTSTVADLTEAWTLRANVYGTAAISRGRVYVLSLQGLYALDPETGAELWHAPGVRGTSSPSVRDNVVYANDFGAVLHALDAATGQELWQANIDENPFAAGFSSPTVAGDIVIVGSSSNEEATAVDSATFRGGMVAFDRETGVEVWRHYTVQPPFNGAAVWSSPTVDLEAGLVFGSTGNNYTGEASDTSDSIFALDLQTGAVVWNTQLTERDVFTIRNPQSEDTDFGTNPLLFDARIDGVERTLVGAGQKSGMFWVLERETGDVVWSRRVSGGSALVGGVFNNGAYDGERLIIAGNNATSEGPGGEPASGESELLATASIPTSVLMALSPSDGSIIWERQLPAWVWAPITIANGVGFVSPESGIQAFNTATGEKLFELDTNGTIASGASVAGGQVFFGSGLSYFNTTEDDTFRALSLP